MYVQYWQAYDWSLALAGLALIGGGLVLLVQAFRGPR